MNSLNRWLVLFGAILVLGVMLRVSSLVTLPAALMIILVVADLWRRRSLYGISYTRRFHYTRSFPGEKIALKVEVENRKLLPISWLRIRDPWPRIIAPEDETILAPSHIPDRGYLTNVFSLHWYERVKHAYQLVFRKRGVYTVGPAFMDSGDLFGFFETTEVKGCEENLIVFPSILPMQAIDLPAENPFGDRRGRKRIIEDPNLPIGVREYRSEDSFRRVHWPATARTGQIQVKVYQPTSGQVMVVCLNIATFERHWEGVYPELLEYLIQAAATMVNEGIHDGYKVGLIANGSLTNADQPFRIPPGRSPQQLGHLLEALAGLSPVVAIPFEQFLLREQPRIPYGATLLIVTAITSLELAEVILKLKRHERRIVLLALGNDVPPEIPGVLVAHRPFQPVTS